MNIIERLNDVKKGAIEMSLLLSRIRDMVDELCAEIERLQGENERLLVMVEAYAERERDEHTNKMG